MPSPFPGVDPFLESQHLWPDFHVTFIAFWREALLRALPRHYEVRVEERVELSAAGYQEDAARSADIAVLQVEEPAQTLRTTPQSSVTPVTVPLVIDEERREHYIEVYHRPERRLVTVLELLSPTNKRSPGYGSYLAKRNEVLLLDVNLVELDLLLQGRRPPFGERLPVADYYAFVSRSTNRPNCDVFAWSIRDRLPKLPVPVLPFDPDAVVDLQAIFDRAYESAGYDRSVKYDAAFTLPVAQVDRDWIEQTALTAAAEE